MKKISFNKSELEIVSSMLHVEIAGACFKKHFLNLELEQSKHYDMDNMAKNKAQEIEENKKRLKILYSLKSKFE